MTVSTERDARQMAKQLGIRFAIVRDWYRQLRLLARNSVAWEWELRQRVWSHYCGPNSESFWRHGMQVDFAYAFGEGDQDAIPGFDEVADLLGWDAQQLFDFIRSPYTRMPSAADTWRELFDRLETNDGTLDALTAGTDEGDAPF